MSLWCSFLSRALACRRDRLRESRPQSEDATHQTRMSFLYFSSWPCQLNIFTSQHLEQPASSEQQLAGLVGEGLSMVGYMRVGRVSRRSPTRTDRMPSSQHLQASTTQCCRNSAPRRVNQCLQEMGNKEGKSSSVTRLRRRRVIICQALVTRRAWLDLLIELNLER